MAKLSFIHGKGNEIGHLACEQAVFSVLALERRPLVSETPKDSRLAGYYSFSMWFCIPLYGSWARLKQPRNR